MARLPSTLPSWNDFVLFATLIYSAVDIQAEWATFSTCRKPVHQWLLASFALLITFRILHLLGQSASAQSATNASDFLVDLRLKGAMPQLLLYTTWFVVMPGFTIWTIAGTVWTWQVSNHTPECLPSQFMWFSLLWQFVSYMWIAAHLAVGFVALSREKRIRLAEEDLRAMEDPDTLQRWGAVSQNHSTVTFRGRSRPGLSPSEIGALGGIRCCSHGHADQECSICLADVHAGETLRQLPSCGHCFHRSCIDLWLLQSSTCPLCKAEVPRCAPGTITGSTDLMV